MHPNPIAETSRSPPPSFRLCMTVLRSFKPYRRAYCARFPDPAICLPDSVWLSDFVHGWSRFAVHCLRRVRRNVATKQTEKPKNRDKTVIAMREELARKIASHAQSPGENPTAIPGMALYRRTKPTACYRASYEPSLSVFVQGRKRVNLGGHIYLCDGSSFLLSSIDVPAESQIVEASELVPLLSMFLQLDM